MNSETELTVLNNLKESIIFELNKVIEQTAANLKYQSNELSENYFHSLAYSKYIQVLLKEAGEYSKRLPINKF